MTSVESSVFTALVIFILLASPPPPPKQTNKRWHGHRNSCGQLQWAQILIIIIQNKNKKYIYIYKKTAIQEKYSYIQQWTRQGLALLYFKQIDQEGGGGRGKGVSKEICGIVRLPI